ncbi:MAG: ester cyclase [Actinomycetota bacterium]|nr:ester cyclase [Actinomycetota bacterium]
MEPTEVDVVRQVFDAFNEGDLQRAVSSVSPICEMTDVAAGQTYSGPDGFRQWLGIFATAFSDGRAELTDVIRDGSRVAVEYIGRGTHDGPFATPAGTIPATGRSAELRFAQVVEVHDASITAVRVYYDGATLLRQLGLMPSQGSPAERGMTTLMALGVKAQQQIRQLRHH